jgi:hypothetical protein
LSLRFNLHFTLLSNLYARLGVPPAQRNQYALLTNQAGNIVALARFDPANQVPCLIPTDLACIGSGTVPKKGAAVMPLRIGVLALEEETRQLHAFLQMARDSVTPVRTEPAAQVAAQILTTLSKPPTTEAASHPP